MIYLVTLLKSVNAFGTLSGILGTLIGFTCGIYMPLVIFFETRSTCCIDDTFYAYDNPIKGILLEEPMKLLTQSLGTDEAAVAMAPYFGINEIGLFGMEVNMFWLMAGSALLAGLLLYLGFRNMNKKIKH